MIELDIDEVNATAKRAASAAARRVPGSTVEDLAQECWVWIMKNEDRIKEWHEDEDGGFGRLYKSLFHYCLDVAQKERAERTGYRADDLYYYSINTLRHSLPLWFEESRSSHATVLPDRDLKVDMDRAWERLTEADKRLLARVYDGDPDAGQTYQALAVEWGCSDESARKRVDRSLRRLQYVLGGERPKEHTRRKVITNANARFITGNQYSAD